MLAGFGTERYGRNLYGEDSVSDSCNLRSSVFVRRLM